MGCDNNPLGLWPFDPMHYQSDKAVQASSHARPLDIQSEITELFCYQYFEDQNK